MPSRPKLTGEQLDAVFAVFDAGGSVRDVAKRLRAGGPIANLAQAVDLDRYYTKVRRSQGWKRGFNTPQKLTNDEGDLSRIPPKGKRLAPSRRPQPPRPPASVNTVTTVTVRYETLDADGNPTGDFETDHFRIGQGLPSLETQINEAAENHFGSETNFEPGRNEAKAGRTKAGVRYWILSTEPGEL